jgi:hypothetical protein
MKDINLLTVLASLLMAWLYLVGQTISVPPGTEVRQGGILARNKGTVRSLGLTAQDMLDLIYAEDEIPGFDCVPHPLTGHHTVIDLDIWGDRPGKGQEGIYSRILRMWNLHTRNPRLDIECWIYSSPEGPKSWFQALLDPRASSASTMFRRGSYSGLPLGDACLRLPHANALFFRLGSIGVRAQVFGPPESDGLFVEALAWGIEYRIRLHPKRLLGMAQKPVTLLVAKKPVAQGRAVSLAGVTVAPISALEAAQVVLETKRTKMEWMVTARRNGQWVKVKAFSWEMETDKGKVKLGRPVFPYKGELIVPLRQVAEALGISVQQKGQTIALLPK